MENRTIIRQFNKRPAYTLIELLTVMGIIIILFGLLVPAMNMVRRHAKRVSQKSQFRNISIALEFFKFEDEDYPDSKVLPNTLTNPCTIGAQHLAEALLGRDLLGYDCWSSGDAKADESRNIYGRGSPSEIQESLDRRIGPYLKLEDVGAFQIFELYKNTGNVYDGNDAPILTDAYRIKKVPLPGGDTVKTGSPILYYKANVHSKILDHINPTGSIYNCEDNGHLMVLGKLDRPTEEHHFSFLYTHPDSRQGRQLFYEAIRNPQVRGLPQPYNRDSYLLLSAGFDGLYGTRDDVFNFGN